MHLAHKIELRPSKAQRAYFQQASGTARFVYNWALEQWNKQYQAGLKPSAMKLKKQFNQIKYQEFPWIETIHRDAHSEPFRNLGIAFSLFFKGNVKHPTFKKRGIHDSFQVANDRLQIKGKKARLPMIGWVRTKEPLRFEGKILSGTVSRTADRWFLSVAMDAKPILKPKTGNKQLGIDLGIKTDFVVSDGRKFEGPKSLKTNLKKLQSNRLRLPISLEPSFGV